MKLKYRINTILKYNNELEKSPDNWGMEAIILGNKCICICNNKKLFVFNKIFRLIQTINLSTRYIFPKNMISILNYPNLFALQEDVYNVHIYEVQSQHKEVKVILKSQIKSPKKFTDKSFYIFSISCADILYYFQDNFFIYDIKEKTFTNKKFCIPSEKKYELFRHEKYIIKIIEYKKNELIILLRDFIYGKENQDYECDYIIKNLIVLYDIENSALKKEYMNTVESTGIFHSYLYNYKYDNNSSYSNSQNIFLINNSIVYIQDSQNEWWDKIYYCVYIINILNGDIKYKFEDNDIVSKCFGFEELFYSFQKSIYLCENIFLFNGHELAITKKGVKQNKVDIIYGTNEDDYKNNKHYFIKIKKDLFLMYNSHEIKICHFAKK